MQLSLTGKSFRRLKPLALATLAAGLWPTPYGCQPRQSSGDTESYVENGQVWAYGSVQLAALDTPGEVMVKREATGQNVDSGAAPAYRLFGAPTAVTPEAAAERDLAYVDLHVGKDRLLAYHYQLEFVPRPAIAGKTNSIIDTFGILRKGGRSYHNRQRVYLGWADFAHDANYATLQRADGLKLSLIGNGVFAGQWALHYPTMPYVVSIAWQGQCPRTVIQAPGQNPSQNPGQYETCKPLPPEVDLCGGNPSQADCRPPSPTQYKPGSITVTQGQPAPAQPASGSSPGVPPAEQQRAVTTLEPSGQDANVYELPADAKEGKIVFTHSQKPTAGSVEDGHYCERYFRVLARTIDGQENAACVVRRSSSEAVGGKLSCALTIGFDRASTYLEKTCNITAIFAGNEAEQTRIQVLKR